MVKSSEIFFLPPQFYEISRFVPYKSHNYLRNFANERSAKGVTIYHPIIYNCTDGIVSVLPGDDFHAGCPRLATVYRDVDFTKEEFRAYSKRIHRMEDIGSLDAAIYLNFEPLDGHLKPQCALDRKHKL
ncbi:acyl-coenzyme A diphosphatase NUDT19-like [Haematobia irritans]